MNSMYIIDHYIEKIRNSLKKKFLKNLDVVNSLDLVTISIPKDSSYGDLTCNAAFVLSKILGIKPIDLAEEISLLFTNIDNSIQSIMIEKPGFINFHIDKEVLQRQLKVILKENKNYGIINKNLGSEGKVIIEYISANPTGPLHVGHCRNAVFGDVIANILQKTGFNVYREFYINDSGSQIDSFIESVRFYYNKIFQKDQNKLSLMYRGDYIEILAKKIAEKYGNRLLIDTYNSEDDYEDDDLEILFKKESINEMMQIIKDDLLFIGIKMDNFVSEKEILNSSLMDEVIEILNNKENLYIGHLPKPKGFLKKDWKESSNLIFKSTLYGDDINRPLKKDNGTWTYFAGDIAYHLGKFKRGFNFMINILGSDHAGYINRLKSAVKAILDDKVKLEIKTTQLVSLLENSIPIKMSKRDGVFISLREIAERVGKDALRFMMVSRNQDTQIDFDFEKVLDKSLDNPVFYIQYAHARACSVIRLAYKLFPNFLNDQENLINFYLLKCPEELILIKKLMEWPRVLQISGKLLEPYRISSYLMEVSSIFHSLWSKGKEDTYLRFIQTNSYDLSLARVALVNCTKIVISNALEVLSIEPLEEL